MITLQKKELSMVFNALSFTDKGETQLFPYEEVLKVNSVAKKIDHLSVDGVLTQDAYAIDFTAEDKEFILKTVKARCWAAIDSQVMTSLTEKLA